MHHALGLARLCSKNLTILQDLKPYFSCCVPLSNADSALQVAFRYSGERMAPHDVKRNGPSEGAESCWITLPQQYMHSMTPLSRAKRKAGSRAKQCPHHHYGTSLGKCYISAASMPLHGMCGVHHHAILRDCIALGSFMSIMFRSLASRVSNTFAAATSKHLLPTHCGHRSTRWASSSTFKSLHEKMQLIMNWQV